MNNQSLRDERNLMKANIELRQKIVTPGVQHRALAEMEGTWDTISRIWIAPHKPPILSTGTCEQKMLFNGRYLQQVFSGEGKREKFNGVNLMGYDTHAKMFISIWIDSMNTGIYFFEGSADAEGKTITQKARYDDPVRGLTVWRSIIRVIDKNTLEYEMYLSSGEGEKEKKMEMTLLRKK